MPRADTGNFNRFLTSIGLLLLAAALLIPYFYFRDSDTLRIPEAELRELTPTGRQALERRQQRSADLEVPILALSVLLAGGGIAALFFGGKRLRIAQGKEDEAIERQARREDYEIQQLSTDEVELRRDEQAREAVRESKAEGSETEVEKPPDDEAPPRAPQPKATPGLARRPAGDRRYAETREEIARIEEKAKSVLERCGSKRFQYRSELQIVGATADRPINIDGLFEGRTLSQPDVVMELNISMSPSSMRMRARIFADRFLADLARYREMTGREALGWLLVVIPDGGDELQSEDERVGLEERLESFLAGLGRCSVIPERDLDELPVRFKRLFEPS